MLTISYRVTLSSFLPFSLSFWLYFFMETGTEFYKSHGWWLPVWLKARQMAVSMSPTPLNL